MGKKNIKTKKHIKRNRSNIKKSYRNQKKINQNTHKIIGGDKINNTYYYNTFQNNNEINFKNYYIVNINTCKKEEQFCLILEKSTVARDGSVGVPTADAESTVGSDPTDPSLATVSTADAESTSVGAEPTVLSASAKDLKISENTKLIVVINLNNNKNNFEKNLKLYSNLYLQTFTFEHLLCPKLVYANIIDPKKINIDFTINEKISEETMNNKKNTNEEKTEEKNQSFNYTLLKKLKKKLFGFFSNLRTKEICIICYRNETNGNIKLYEKLNENVKEKIKNKLMLMINTRTCMYNYNFNNFDYSFDILVSENDYPMIINFYNIEIMKNTPDHIIEYLKYQYTILQQKAFINTYTNDNYNINDYILDDISYYLSENKNIQEYHNDLIKSLDEDDIRDIMKEKNEKPLDLFKSDDNKLLEKLISKEISYDKLFDDNQSTKYYQSNNSDDNYLVKVTKIDRNNFEENRNTFKKEVYNLQIMALKSNGRISMVPDIVYAGIFLYKNDQFIDDENNDIVLKFITTDTIDDNLSYYGIVIFLLQEDYSIIELKEVNDNKVLASFFEKTYRLMLELNNFLDYSNELKFLRLNESKQLFFIDFKNIRKISNDIKELKLLNKIQLFYRANKFKNIISCIIIYYMYTKYPSLKDNDKIMMKNFFEKYFNDDINIDKFLVKLNELSDKMIDSSINKYHVYNNILLP